MKFVNCQPSSWTLVVYERPSIQFIYEPELSMYYPWTELRLAYQAHKKISKVRETLMHVNEHTKN